MPAAIIAVLIAYGIGTLNSGPQEWTLLALGTLANLLGGVSLGTAVYEDDRFADLSTAAKTSVATALGALIVTVIAVVTPALMPGPEGEGALSNRLAVIAVLASAFLGTAAVVAVLGLHRPPGTGRIDRRSGTTKDSDETPTTNDE